MKWKTHLKNTAAVKNQLLPMHFNPPPPFFFYSNIKYQHQTLKTEDLGSQLWIFNQSWIGSAVCVGEAVVNNNSNQ